MPVSSRILCRRKSIGCGFCRWSVVALSGYAFRNATRPGGYRFRDTTSHDHGQQYAAGGHCSTPTGEGAAANGGEGCCTKHCGSNKTVSGFGSG